MKAINGKEIAKKILGELKERPVTKKILAALLIGNNPASESFVRQKEKTASELGVDFRIYRLPEAFSNDDLRREIGRIGGQKSVGGIIVQLPLPAKFNRHYVLNAIPREKDIDVLGERALGAFYTGRNTVNPPAVGVVSEIITNRQLLIADYRIAVAGLGFLVGKPIAVWLMGQAKEIIFLDKGFNSDLLKGADLVISGVGKPGLIKPEMLKEGASLIDFGYGAIEIKDEKGEMIRRLAGDFDVSQLITNNLRPTTGWYTPTPGGTGPILVAQLFYNFYKLTQEPIS